MPDIENKATAEVNKTAGTLDQLQRAAFAVRDMREKLEAEKARAHAPIAIIGMGCRFPAAPDIGTFWRSVINGVDAIRQVPESRWDSDAYYDPDPDAPGKTSSLWGGLIDDVDLFDAEFFGISPREAKSVDPQQRLLLETSWRALEDAAIPIERLPARHTGVYVGISTNDYASLLADRTDQNWIDAHASLGNSVAVAAGRISYTLGLQGPSMSVDTACSSSLVAVHLAMKALRTGEIDVAISAGVNLTLTPELTIGFSKARMMAADGRCKTFDARADGYVRGEGCGVVILKRLEDALRDGNRVRAVLIGSAVNQDGRSNGLTAPNGPSQTAVIKAALADAHVQAGQVSLIEAHGTGTALGDPIEAQALSDVFAGRESEAAAPYVASVKTNIGHLEAAAGMAGLIKTALALENGKVPPHLHFQELSPHINADQFPLRIPISSKPMPDVDGRQIAGVSSFGFSGTNAHVVLEAPPKPAEAPTRKDVEVLTISGSDAQAVGELVRQTCEHLEDPDVDFPAFAATMTSGRSTFPYRMAVTASTAAEAAKALRDKQPECPPEDPLVGFLFTGQGSQYQNMASGLMSEPRFRETIERCDSVLNGIISPILKGGTLPEGRTDLVQPLLVTLEYAMADLWRSWGVQPAAVIGHSVGEIAAAAFAGALNLEDALRFVAERGRLMESRADLGGMAAVLASAEKVSTLIEGSDVVIAALNAPDNTVISGTTRGLAQVMTRLENAAIPVVPLQVSTAFHSPVLDPVLDDIEAAAVAMATGRAHIPVINNLHAEACDRFDAAYWRAQAAAPVRFREGLQCLADRGCSLFVEIGPQPVLSNFGRTILPEATFVPSLRRGVEDARTIADAAAQLFTAGVPVNFSAFCGRHKVVDAPGHPFRGERYWPDAAPANVIPLSTPTVDQSLVGTVIDTPGEPVIHQRVVSTEALPFLADHVVFGDVVVPGAMYAVMGIAVSGAAPGNVEDLVFEAPMTVPIDGLVMQTLTWLDGRLEIYGRIDGSRDWVRHVCGRINSADTADVGVLDLSDLEGRLLEESDGPNTFFQMLGNRGIELGDSFRGLRRLWRGNAEAMGEIEQTGDNSTLDVLLHPTALDSCFQILGATFTGDDNGKGFLPLSLDRMEIYRQAPKRFRCHATIESAANSPVAIGQFTLCDLSGQIFARASGLQIKQVEAPKASDPVSDMILGVEWVPCDIQQPGWSNPTQIASLVNRAAANISPLEENGLSEGLDALAAHHARVAVETLPDVSVVADDRQRLYQRLRSLAAKDNGMSSQELLAAFPHNQAEIGLVDRCGAALQSALVGMPNAVENLISNSDELNSNVYSDKGLAARTNEFAAAALAAALGRRADHKLSILEVGAGTGATTQALLRQIPQSVDVEYLFTDISNGFIHTAEQQFADNPKVQFALFDLEQDPATQELPMRRFDIIVAANVIHATRDIAQSLNHIQKLLLPGGLLMLVESTLKQDWWDIVFGLTDGWWRFEDTDLRPDHPLLGQSAWPEVLKSAGYIDPVTVSVDAAARQSIILAKAPLSAPVIAVHDGFDGQAKTVALALAEALTQAGTDAIVTEPEAAINLIGQKDGQVIIYTGGISAPYQRALKQAFDLSRAVVSSADAAITFAVHGLQPDTNSEDNKIITHHTDDALVSAAAVAGFARVFALEHPETGAGIINLDPASTTLQGDLLTAIAANASGEREISIHAGKPHTARLVPQPLDAIAAPELDASGAYLITGAFGGLGSHLAAWLGEHGAGQLILIGRNAPSPELAATLSACAKQVDLHELDVCDADALGRIVAEAGQQLKGVFHLAGTTADGAIISQDWSRFSSVLGSKADTALVLDELTQTLPLDHFVLFSTSASLIGNPGQANHAAANAILDAIAGKRRACGLPGLSINWGAFSQAGAVVRQDQLESMSQRGVKPITIEQGLDALARAMQADTANIGVVNIDWPMFLKGTEAAFPPFLSHFRDQLTVKPTQSRSAPRKSQADFSASLENIAQEERQSLLAGLIAIEAAAVLDMKDPAKIDHDQALNELGLDSLLALELRNRLGEASGQKQLATLLFDHPSIAALAEHIDNQLSDKPSGSDKSGRPAPITPQDRASDEELESMSDAEIEEWLNAEYTAATGLQ